MGYIGNQTSNSYTSLDKQTITGNGGASYTLDHAVANVNEIEVFVNNVRQEPAVAYTVSGTALTMTGNVASTDDFYVVFQGKAIQTTVPPDDSVTTAKLATPIGIETTSSTFKMTDLSTNAFYRSGTWTPVWSSSGATDKTASIVSGTYTTQFGHYVRIGDMVFYTCKVESPSTWTYTNGGAVGQQVYIAGLPFSGASSNGASEQWGGSVGYINGWTWSTGYSVQPLVYYGEPYIRLWYNIANVTTSVFTTSMDNANSTIYVSGQYRTEDA